MEEIKRMFSPEFRNRLDGTIQFRALAPETIAHVVDKFLVELESQLDAKKVTMEVSQEARAWLAEHGYDRLMGARPMNRLIREKIKKPLAEELLFGKLAQGGHVGVVVRDDDIAIEFESETALENPA
jgi:ATP-dependent Clp protease ATP-binding subunit ClpA